jgi:GNAT superfamily N-acetyltransferase
VDVAESGDRTPHVLDPGRRHGNVVGQAQALGRLEDRVHHRRAQRPARLRFQAGEEGVEAVHVLGAVHLGEKDAGQVGAHGGPEVPERLAGVRWLHADEPARRSGVPRRLVEEGPDPVACRFALVLGVRRARLLQVDHDGVGTVAGGPEDLFVFTAPHEQQGPDGCGVFFGHGSGPVQLAPAKSSR